MSLLQNLHTYADHLSEAVVNDQVFPQIALGFAVCWCLVYYVDECGIVRVGPGS